MKKIPFFSNTEDNTHCFQAAIQIVLKYFLPQEEYSIEELDRITAKVKDLWTWPMAGILNLRKKGFDVVILDAFNYEKFSKEGTKYLYDLFGSEVAGEQIKHSDINQEIEFTKQMLKEDIRYIKEPSLDEISKLLNQGYLVICNVNANSLNNEEGYEGHFVVVYNVDSDFVYFQDPGLPPRENRKETKKDFEESWSVTHDAYAFKLI